MEDGSSRVESVLVGSRKEKKLCDSECLCYTVSLSSDGYHYTERK